MATEVPGMHPLIFCIGLNKTGTTSLHRAFIALGLESLHWGGPATRVSVERALREQKPLLQYLPRADAYSDIQRLSMSFDTLDNQYPGSRFILTTRDVDSWLDSRRRHVLRNRERKATGEYDGTFLEIEPDRWRAQFVEHHERVDDYFEGRDDLLRMAIIDGDGYETLCPFLDLPEPEEPFPWRHRDVATDA